MAKLIPVRVECHSGFKSDEYPICFYLDNKRYDIQEIADRWYQSDNNPEWPVSNYFKVNTLEGNQFILKHYLEKDEWFLYK